MNRLLFYCALILICGRIVGADLFLSWSSPANTNYYKDVVYSVQVNTNYTRGDIYHPYYFRNVMSLTNQNSATITNINTTLQAYIVEARFTNHYTGKRSQILVVETNAVEKVKLLALPTNLQLVSIQYDTFGLPVQRTINVMWDSSKDGLTNTSIASVVYVNTNEGDLFNLASFQSVITNWSFTNVYFKTTNVPPTKHAYAVRAFDTNTMVFSDYSDILVVLETNAFPNPIFLTDYYITNSF